MRSPERYAAVNAVYRTMYEGAYSGRVVDLVCKNELSDRRQKAFFTKLYLGTVEKSFFLDEAVKKLSKRRLKDIQRRVLCVLKISLYQLLFMDNVADSVAISLALNLCEEFKQSKAKAFVNGVLGAVSRLSENRTMRLEHLIFMVAGDNPDETTDLSLRYSMPKWIVEYLSEGYGTDKVKTIFNNLFAQDHRLTLRVNLSRISMDKAYSLLAENGLNPTVLEGLPAIELGTGCSPGDIPGLSAGLFYIQDQSSIRAVCAACIKPGDNIVDVCAAPGGKGLLAAMLTGPEGSVSMRDIHENKIKIIQSNIDTSGAGNASVKLWDARETDPDYIGKADVVICDVPCSGLGTIGNKPEIKYRLNKEEIVDLATLGRGILETASGYVKPGGKLLFSTCTLSVIENDATADNFLESHPEFSELERQTLFPDKTGSDGFFYCVMCKRGQTSDNWCLSPI